MDIRRPNLNTEYLGPICKFGPGGDYVSAWPAVPLYSIAAAEPNPLGRVLETIARMIGLAAPQQLDLLKSCATPPTRSFKK